MTALFTGMYNIRPKEYKTPKTWKVENILNLFRKWGPTHLLTITQLTYKTAMLTALTSGARASELAHLDTKSMRTHEGEGIEFELRTHKKAKKSKVLPGKLFIPSFRDTEHIICPVSTLEQYLIATGRMASLCQDESIVTWEKDPIFRKTTKPHTGVTPTTISKWITNVIYEAEGIQKGTQLLGHSTRSKGAEKAWLAGLSTKEIMLAADWKTETVFKNHYHQPTYCTKFGRAVLQRKVLSDKELT